MLVLTSLLLALLAPTPQPTNPFTLDPIPASSQLPLIGTTHTRALCSAMKKVVAPAIAAAMTNDRTYTTFRKSLNDYVIMSTMSNRDFKLMLLDRSVDSMVKSIAEMETALNASDFTAPPSASRADSESLAAMRESLRRVLAAQKVQLDAMSGFVETERMRTMGQFSEGEANLQSALSPTSSQPSTGINNSGIGGPSSGPLGVTQPNHDPANQNSGIGDPNTSFGFLHDSNAFFEGHTNISLAQAHQLDADLGDLAAFTSKREDVASKIIIPATALCK